MKHFYSLLTVILGTTLISFGQNVGVDIATPEQKLDVAGGLKLGNTANGVAGSLRWNGTNFQVHNGTQWITFGAGTDNDWAITGNDMYSQVSGNVGIGTTTPAEKLQVVGTARLGGLNINGNYTLPTSDGGAGFVLTTNGSGTVTWSNPALVGDITAVIAGDGLINGGTSGDVTLDVNPGDGIQILSDEVRVRASDLDNATNGLSVTSNDFAVNVDNSTLDINGDVLRVAPDGITTSQILDGTVSSADIALNTIQSNDIATGGVQSVDILDGTVAEADMESPGNDYVLTTDGAGNVTWATQNSFNAAQAGDGLIDDGNEIDVNVDNVTLDINADVLRVKPDGIGTAQIATGGVTSSDILDGTVTSADIATNTIQSNDIATGGVQSVDILDGTVAEDDMESPGNDYVLTTDGSGNVTWATQNSFNAAQAGDGLIDDGNEIDVNVDNVTLDINADVLRVKPDGIGTAQIATGGVTSSDILDGTVTSADIATNTIQSNDIATGGVQSVDILDGTVAEDDMESPGNDYVLTTDGSGNVTWATQNSFNAGQAGDGLVNDVPNSEIDVNVDNSTIVINSDVLEVPTGGITTSQILDGTIVTADIATGGVTSDDIANNTIVTADIATGAVESSDILDGTVAETDMESPGNDYVLTTDGSGNVTWATQNAFNAAQAGDGLVDDGNEIDVNVDNSTIEINSDIVRVKAEGITANEIATGGVTTSEILDGTVLPADMDGPGSPNLVLSTDASNVVGWNDPASLTTTLEDRDTDTYISVDNLGSPDDDVVRVFNRNVESMTIDEAGEVGIGTDTPEKNLHVVGASGAQVVLSRGDANTNAGETLGELLFDSEDDTDPSTVDASAVIRGIAAEDQGNSDKGGHMAFLTKPVDADGSAAAAEHMRITSDGNVGIGTTTAPEKLTLNGSIRGNQSGALRISTGSGYVDVGPTNTGWSHFYTDRNRYFFNKGITVDQGFVGSYDENLSLQTSGTTRVTVLNSDGNVGIGTTSPAQKLHVTGGARFTDFSAGIVISDALGNLSISTDLSSTVWGDNLGDHTATQTLNMNSQDISNVKEQYMQNWIRWSDNDGLYWSNTGNHIYGSSSQDLIVRSGHASGGSWRLQNDVNTRGYLHWTATDQGWLNEARQWQLRTENRDGYSPSLYFDEEGNEAWTGNPGADEGKIEYHSNRFYIAAGINSTEIVRFRRSGTDLALIDNNGYMHAPRFYDFNNSSYYADPASTSYFNDMRANIYYDRNNTSYYMNPASNSVINTIRIAGGSPGTDKVLRSDGSGNASWVDIGAANIGDNLGNHLATQGIGRNNHNTGYLEGSYNNVGGNSSYTNPIYTIGSSYVPGTTSLGNMYGIGYSHSNLWGTSGARPSGWGQYVAADGDIRIIFEASNGRIWASGDVRAPRFYDSNNTSYFADPASVSYYNDFRPNIIYDRNNTSYYWNGDGTTMENVSYNRGNVHIGDGSGSGADLYIADRLYDWDNTGYYIDPNVWCRLDETGTNRGYFYWDVRAPIFYDYNNTGYYLDPAGSNSMFTYGNAWLSHYAGRTHVGHGNGSGYYCCGTNWWGSCNCSAYNRDLSVYGGAEAIAWYGWSDGRYKKNISTVTGALDIIQSLRGVYYDWDVDGELPYDEAIKSKKGATYSKSSGSEAPAGIPASRIGVIAQEVEDVLPQVVAHFEDTDSSGAVIGEHMAVNYDDIIPVLIEAIKEQQTQIEELKALVLGTGDNSAEIDETDKAEIARAIQDLNSIESMITDEQQLFEMRRFRDEVKKSSKLSSRQKQVLHSMRIRYGL